MKLNFNNLLQIIKNNKFIILGAFILLILILNTKPIIEGLTSSIGEYDYLQPIPSDNKISDDIARQFADKSNEINCPPGSPTPCGIDTSSTDGFSAWKKGLEKNITEPEVNYYITNGKFPYNGYVMNWVKNHPDKFPNQIDTYQRMYFNRVLYDMYIKPTEATMTPPPLAYNIFMGTAKPPPNFNYAATHPSSTTPSTSAPSTTVVPSNDENYNDFISLCKKTLAQ
jgi:hypothetical protein